MSLIVYFSLFLISARESGETLLKTLTAWNENYGTTGTLPSNAYLSAGAICLGSTAKGGGHIKVK